MLQVLDDPPSVIQIHLQTQHKKVKGSATKNRKNKCQNRYFVFREAKKALWMLEKSCNKQTAIA